MIKCHSFLLQLVFMTGTICLSTQQEQCQRVSTQLDAKIPPVAYNGIQPDLTGCTVRGDGSLDCPAGGVLGDGDIGPLHSVDVNDPNQVRQFYVWHQSNGTVNMEFQLNPIGQFNISYINIYTLTNTAAGIGVPSSPSISVPRATINVVSQQNCVFSSDTNTVMRTTLDLTFRTVTEIAIYFSFTTGAEIEWLFLSEVELCQEIVLSPITCGTPPPNITLSFPPPAGMTVTPDLHHPHSVSLTCSISSPPNDGYQYQWQWWWNGSALHNSGRFSIMEYNDTQSIFSSLVISELRYSDAGEYMCVVEYASCPGRYECGLGIPTSGLFQLNLSVIIMTERWLRATPGGYTQLKCEVYGYLRSEFSPQWTKGGEVLETDNYCTKYCVVTETGEKSAQSVHGANISSIMSVLTIHYVSENDAGRYVCLMDENSHSTNLEVETSGEKFSAGLVVGLAVLAALLAVSLAANLVVFVYHLWKRNHDTEAGKSGHVEQLYEQVTKTQIGEAGIKNNEAHIYD